MNGTISVDGMLHVTIVDNKILIPNCLYKHILYIDMCHSMLFLHSNHLLYNKASS